MMTIGYIDRCDGNQKLKAFTVTYAPNEVKYTRWDRVREAFAEIEGLGNVNIYLIKGRKVRQISQRGM